MHRRFFLFCRIAALIGVLAAGPTAAQNSRENADFKLAINLYNDGLYDLASEQLRQFIAAYPATDQGIEARFYLGLTQLKLTRYDEARLTFQTFALTYQTNPRAAEAWWNVGESYAAVDNHREAALAFERVKVFHPRSKLAPDALVRAGAYFRKAGERESARRVLRSVLQEYGGSPAALSARTQLGQLYFEEGNLDQALQELRRVVEGDPSPEARAQALLVMAGINQATGRIDLAKSQYQEIAATYKGTGALHGAEVNLGKLQADAGEFKAAEENFKRALTRKGQVDTLLARDAMLGLADVYAAQKQYAQAVDQYERFLRTYPSDPSANDALWKASRAAARAREFKRSNDCARRLIDGTASDLLKRRGLIQLALNAQDQRTFAQAIRLYGDFVERYPDDPATPDIMYRTGALLENEQRDPASASVLFELLVARHGTAAIADNALFAAARARETQKDYQRALHLYGELTRRYPASDLRPDAEGRVNAIETFEAKDKDSGLEKLALLLGDVVAERDRSALAFRLGEIYYRDLKNYEAAVEQFTAAATGNPPVPQALDALFYRARSYEFLSRRHPASRTLAIESYTAYLERASGPGQSQPAERRDDAAYALFTMSATSLPEARSAFTATTVMMPGTAHRDRMLLRIGNLQSQVDSIDGALKTFEEVLAISSAPAVREEATYRLFELAAARGLADSGLAAGKKYLAAYPDGPRAAGVLARLGDLSMRRSDPAGAVEHYRTLVSDFSYASVAAGAEAKLAAALLASGRAGEAQALYQQLVDRARNDVLGPGDVPADLLVGLGTSLFRNANAPAAKKALFEAVSGGRSGPAVGEAYATLAAIYKAEGSAELAAAYYREATKASPQAEARRDVADMLYDAGEYPEAGAQYARLAAGATDPVGKQYFEARVILSALRAGDTKKADARMSAFRKAYDNTRDDLASFELERGSAHYRNEEYPEAIKAFETVVDDYSNSPSEPWALYWWGKSLEVSGKPAEAVKHYLRILDDFPAAPAAPRAHLALGNLAYQADRYDESIKQYRVLVDDPSTDPELLRAAMSNLIGTYETANIHDAALSLTRRYLERFPNAEDTFDKRIKIGILYQRLGYYDQSVLHLQELLNEAGSDLEGEIRYYIGEAQYAKGDYRQAILEFLKVPYLVTKKGKVDWTATSLYMAGQSYERMGKHEQALTMYQQIIDRPAIDATFKAAAQKEIDRVKTVLTKDN
jgi:TolA-binding protein